LAKLTRLTEKTVMLPSDRRLYYLLWSALAASLGTSGYTLFHCDPPLDYIFFIASIWCSCS